MKAGPLDRRIVIEQFVSEQDEFGQPIEAWSQFAKVWASKLDIVGRERLTSAQELATETTTFRIRWLDGLLPSMRILYDGKIYDITGIAELGRRDGLDITATAQPLG